MPDQQPGRVQRQQLFQADELGGRSVLAHFRHLQTDGLQHAACIGVRAVNGEAVFAGNAEQHLGIGRNLLGDGFQMLFVFRDACLHLRTFAQRLADQFGGLQAALIILATRRQHQCRRDARKVVVQRLMTAKVGNDQVRLEPRDHLDIGLRAQAYRLPFAHSFAHAGQHPIGIAIVCSTDWRHADRSQPVKKRKLQHYHALRGVWQMDLVLAVIDVDRRCLGGARHQGQQAASHQMRKSKSTHGVCPF